MMKATLTSPSILIAAFGTSVTGCALADAAARLLSVSFRRNVTFTPISGRIRGSSFLNAMRTRTVAFCRSAVGTIVITRAGICQSGYASSTALTSWPGVTRLM